jgi:hypothetical protein
VEIHQWMEPVRFSLESPHERQLNDMKGRSRMASTRHSMHGLLPCKGYPERGAQ